MLVCQHTCTVLPSTGSTSTSRLTNARAAGSACHAPNCRQQQQRSRLSTACLLTLCPYGQASSAAAKQVNAARAPGRTALASYTVLLVVTTRAQNLVAVLGAQAKPAGSPGKAARATGGKAPAKADKSAPKDPKAAPAPK